MGEIWIWGTFVKSRRNSLQSRLQMFPKSCLQMSFVKKYSKNSFKMFPKKMFPNRLWEPAIPVKPLGWRSFKRRSSSRCRARRLDSQTTESQRHKAKVWMESDQQENGNWDFWIDFWIYIYIIYIWHIYRERERSIFPIIILTSHFWIQISFWQMVVYGVNFVLLVV